MTKHNETQTEQKLTKPDPRLKNFDRLIGTWKVTGPDELDGTVSFEWMKGGFFLLQHVDLNHHGRKIQGIEYIGIEYGWDQMQQPGYDSSTQDITSHYFDNQGSSLSYTWEIENDILTIWGGVKGSPAKYEGKFSADGHINRGGWTWSGGGYESTMTRIN